MIDPDRFAPWVSDEAQALFRAERTAPPPPDSDISALRAHYDAFNRRHLAVALDQYRVQIASEVVGGVCVDVIAPSDGVASGRTLLCLHGGAFMWGRGAGALLEAVPVAAVAKMRVIAVEYALAPERVFPAAVEDVLAVFDTVCARQPARSIGVYGCSAGGVLTAQLVARLVAEGRAVPGAVAMLCGTGLDMYGDSAATAGPLTGASGAAGPASLAELPYLVGADVSDPLVFPGGDVATLSRFPPSLLVSGTRDFAASSVMEMHRRLLRAGADASLLMFDGMWHAHHMATTLPEARETFATLARFFDRHLG